MKHLTLTNYPLSKPTTEVTDSLRSEGVEKSDKKTSKPGKISSFKLFEKK